MTEELNNNSNRSVQLQSFGHLMRRTDSLEKTLMLGKINEIIKTAAGVLGGGGGGRLTLAQGACKNADKMDEAIKTAVGLI